ncbi:(2Fe-2S) ferredoxin domain-containing protein [Alloiococcus sp. CFN-8]|uniref:(2Fe-2S) ferredoxin domain-containing protein n=1 Tax=Alloiococcus sp. CFN-8 TaxID=3416081 RepID=UPI003CEBA864
MKIIVCIGSSCHLKGSRLVVEQLQELIIENKLEDKVSLCGSFCMNNCISGVTVEVGDKVYSLQPESTRAFFEEEIMKRL